MMKLMLLMMKMLLMVLMIGDDDPAGASPVYLAFGVPCQWMCDEKDALTRLAPDEIGQRLIPDKSHSVIITFMIMIMLVSVV